MLVSAVVRPPPPRPTLSADELGQGKIPFAGSPRLPGSVDGHPQLADGQPFCKQLPEIVLVCNQHCLQSMIQKQYVLFQSGEVTGDTSTFKCKSLDILMLQKSETSNNR